MSDITRSESIKILKEHLSHWERLLQEHICEDQEGIDTISALKLAIASLETDEAYQLEYERTTKNDLGVDAISRDEVCRYVAEFVNHEFSTREEEELIDNIITGIEHMPPATPQEPRSEWEQDHEILKDIPYGGDATVRRIQEVIEDKV